MAQTELRQEINQGNTEQGASVHPEMMEEECSSGKNQKEDIEKRKNMEFVKGVFFGTLISAVCVLGMFLVNNGTVGFEWGRSVEAGPGSEVLTSLETRHKLEEVRQKIDSAFLYDVDGEDLISYLFKGLTVGLNDPYANYYTAEELKTITESNQGEYYGIGITLLQDMASGRLHVAGVYEGSPAETAGMKVDDEIIAVDGESVTGMDLSSAVALIKNKEESLELTLLRDGVELTLTVEPDSIEIPTVSCEMLEDGIGYLKITEFDSITVQQFEDAMQQLEGEGMEKLVVAVRDNPGGVLSSVCDILRQILPEGLIVYTEDKNGKREEYTCNGVHALEKPLVVLVNNNSASASEIFAGAVQDYGLGTIIGETTYGKGVVQRTFLLDDGSALKLTSEKYFTPKGQDIDGTGIKPDIVVEQEENSDTDLQLAEALEVLKQE